MNQTIPLTRDQIMDIAIAGFGKPEWSYNSKDLFESVASVVKNTYSLFINGVNVMSVYMPSKDHVTFFTKPNMQFNHMAATNKLKQILNL